MLYQGKATPEDFIVKEILTHQPNGKGDVFFVLFEKTNKNTMDIVQEICTHFWIKRNDIGIAWLKDKVGITQQRMSIHKERLHQMGGQQKLLSFLKTVVKVIETNRWNEALKVGWNKGNAFIIRLRALPKLYNHPQKNSIEKLIRERLEDMKTEWFPNCFWQQRFWKWDKNFKRAQEILKNIWNETDVFEIRFKLQAYASMFFNDYTLSRRLTKKKLVQGDIVVDRYHAAGIKLGVYEKDQIKCFEYETEKNMHKADAYFFPESYTKTIPYVAKTRIPTGPMVGTNLLLPPKDSPAYKLDRKLLQIIDFFKQGIHMAEKYNLFWIRRPLRVIPENLTYKRDHHDIILSFNLPTGSYATVMLWFLFDTIDYATCLENKRTIPNTLTKV